MILKRENFTPRILKVIHFILTLLLTYINFIITLKVDYNLVFIFIDVYIDNNMV